MVQIEPATWAKVIALGAFLLIAGVAAAAQASLFHINRARFRSLIETGVPRARATAKAFEEPTPIFVNVLVLSAVAVAGVSAMTVLLALDPSVIWPWGALTIVAGVLVALLVVEVAARTVAIAQPEACGLALVGPMRVVGILLWPLTSPLQSLERLGLRLLGVTRITEPAAVAEEELRLFVETVEDSAALEEEKREMIHGIIELSERPAREVMIPRIDVAAEPREASVRQVLDRIVATGYSRIPIFTGSIDNVVGLVYAKDILRHLRGGTLDDPVEPIARAAYFVPETKKVNEVLHDLQSKRVHVAIVVDEYGGTAGLLTIEDLLEEIVGEIHDEYDVNETQLIEQISERELVVDARVPLRDVNDVLDLDLDDDELDTIGGLVYHELGKVPVVGDEVRVDGCVVTVLSTQGRRIGQLRVRLVDEQSPAGVRAASGS